MPTKVRSQHSSAAFPIQRLGILFKHPEVRAFFSKRLSFARLVDTLKPDEQLIVVSVIVAGQGEVVFGSGDNVTQEDLLPLLEALASVESFYKEIGGILGYHETCMTCLEESKRPSDEYTYLPPHSLDISKATRSVRQAYLHALKNLDQFAEIYPLGGAADRLSHWDVSTGTLQTAALFTFCGRTLLQRLLDDLQAREHLSYRLYGKHVHVPVAIMTSEEKANDARVRAVFHDFNWFGRLEEEFMLFSQPLVPAMDKQGTWCCTGPLKPLLKPGGHGVIWKLAQERGVFDWLRKKGHTKALVRQINNLVAGVDYGLMAFQGIGLLDEKKFGFASCPRIEGISEGVNVIAKKGNTAALTNIEYCDSQTNPIDETSGEFLSNTNILFVDLETIESLISTCPFPGMLVNSKELTFQDDNGSAQKKHLSRLESTMQNIAGELVEKEKENGALDLSYITKNDRLKTISTIKREYVNSSDRLQTPQQCFYDLVQNAHELLKLCDFVLPPIRDEEKFFLKGPAYTFLYHPTLGPIYEIIQQKLHGGRIAAGSDLQLNISEIECVDLRIDGALLVTTDALVGHTDTKGSVKYSHRTGKCILKNVHVLNEGLAQDVHMDLWKGNVAYRQRCTISIEEGGEFVANDLTLQGEMEIHVPKNTRVTAHADEDGGIILSQTPLSKPTWIYTYSVSKDDHIILQKELLEP